jgi:hypothetical protein
MKGFLTVSLGVVCAALIALGSAYLLDETVQRTVEAQFQTIGVRL